MISGARDRVACSKDRAMITKPSFLGDVQRWTALVTALTLEHLSLGNTSKGRTSEMFVSILRYLILDSRFLYTLGHHIGTDPN